MRTSSTPILLVSMLLLAAPAGAQRPQPEQPEPPPNIAEPPASDVVEPRRSSQPIALSGCLQRGEAQEADSFVLKRTAGTGVPTPDAGPGADAGTDQGDQERARESADAEAPALSTYRLVPGDPTVELGDHVGHQVQVRGTLQVSSGDLTTTTGASGTGQTGTGRQSPEAPDGAPSTAGSQAPAPGTPILTTLEVTSLQMIDDSCAEVTRP